MNTTFKAMTIAAAMTAAAYAATANAQTTAPAPPSPQPTTSATRPAMVEAKGPWLGTQMWKQAVYTADNETRIGEIDNMVINRNGQIEAVVVGVGGFLGLGEKNVAFKYTDLTPLVRNGNIWYVVKMSKDQINSLPTFDASAYKH